MTKKLFVSIILTLAFGFLSANAQTKPSGSGTQSDPYQIGTYDELLWFAGVVNGTLDGADKNTSACAELTANITVNSNVLKSGTTTFSNSTVAVPTYELNGSKNDFKVWVPMGRYQAESYTGTFDGKGFTISGLVIDVDRVDLKGYGLFGYIENATLQNINIADSYIYGQINVGGLCGCDYTSTITNCSFDGYTMSTSGSYTGGLIGFASNSTISNCSNKGYVYSTSYAGGIVGYASDANISWCKNEATIGGSSSYSGGITGHCFDGSIADSYNLGAVTGTYYAAGVAGYLYAGMSNCWSYGLVVDNYSRGQAIGFSATSGYTNVFYVNQGDCTDSGTKKDTSAFAGGEITYLLNGDQTTIHYYQTLGVDPYPTTDPTHKIVYAIKNCQGNIIAYTNDKDAAQGVHAMKEHVANDCYETYWTCDYESNVYYSDALAQTKIDIEQEANHDWVYDTTIVATPEHKGLLKVYCSRDASHPQKTVTLHKIDCLWLTAEKANSTVVINKVGTLTNDVSLSYSTDTLHWNEYTFGKVITLPEVGSYVCFKATTENGALATDSLNYCQFVMEGAIAATGNVDALRNDSLTTSNSVPSYGYCNLFKDCAALTKAPTLPSMYMEEACYLGMFEGCTSLTEGPELPSINISNSCYKKMFKGCTSLTTAPMFTPSFTNYYDYQLTNNCFEEMFSGCTSLTSSPSVRGVLRPNSCRFMFKGCTSLTTAPAIEAPYVDEYSCYGMFSGCTSLTSAPALTSNITGDGYTYARMFENCTSLEESPLISAPDQSGRYHCYDSMFVGCKKLHIIKTTFSKWKLQTCNWVINVADTGTFICTDIALPKIYSDSCIPFKWSYHTLTKTTVCEPTCTTDGYTQEVWVCPYDDCKNICYKDELAQEQADPSIILPALGHDWYKTDTVLKATCSAEGQYVKYCKNDETHTQSFTIDKLSHNWGEWTTTTEPTCIQREIRTRYCLSDSAHVEYDTLDYGDHKWPTHSQVILEPTELAKGAEIRHCDYDYYHTKVDSIPSTGVHTWKDYTRESADCINDGYMVYQCSDCGKFDTTIIKSDTSLHTWVLVVDRASNCTDRGFKLYECSFGYHTDTVWYDLDSDAHNWSDPINKKSPTCSDQGISIRICDFNENHIDTIFTPIDSTKHNYGAVYTVKEPDCTNTGMQIRYCANDSSHTISSVIDIDPNAHEWSDLDTVAMPTCVANGLAIRTCAHNAMHIDSFKIDMINTHVWGDWDTIQVSNCSQSGKRIRYCIYDSAHSQLDLFRDNIEHDWGVWDTTEVPTCTEYGTRIRYCKNDSSHRDYEVLEFFGHEWIPTDTVIPNNCMSKIRYNFVCAHDSSHTETTYSSSVIGHDVSVWDTTLAPTCTTSGLREGYCSRCGGIAYGIDPLGHLWGEADTVEATCTTPKKVIKVCQRDSNHIDVVAVLDSALGHQMNYHEGTAATCTEQGTLEYWTCTREPEVIYADSMCTSILTNVVTDALGHEMVYHEGTAATCTEQGTLEYWTCTREADVMYADSLGSSTLTSVATDALGHQWSDYDTTEVSACYLARERICLNENDNIQHDTVFYGCADVVIYDNEGNSTTTKWREYTGDPAWHYEPTENSLMVTADAGIKGVNVVLTTSEGNSCSNLVLDDDYGFASPLSFKVDTFKYNRNVTNTVETLVLPVGLPVSSVTGVVYEFEGVSDGQFSFIPTSDSLRANKPYLVKDLTPGNQLVLDVFNVSLVASQPVDVSINEVSYFGTYSEKNLSTTNDLIYYMLTEGEFAKTASATLNPFRAAISSSEGELTGVEIVNQSTEDGKVNVFDVMGRLIRYEVEVDHWYEGLKDGIYMANGHKYIVKNQKVVGSN